MKLRRLPTRSTLPRATREMLTRARRREADAKRRAGARSARRQAKTAQQKPPRVPAPPVTAPDPQGAEARRAAQAAVQAQRAQGRQVLAGRICAYLAEHGPTSQQALHSALGESVVLVRQTLGALRFDGQVAQVDTWPRTYQLVVPGLDPAPAQLDGAACRVRALLAHAPNSELGLVRASGLKREEVRGALSRLDACGLLAWRVVGHLSIYRLYGEEQEGVTPSLPLRHNSRAVNPGRTVHVVARPVFDSQIETAATPASPGSLSRRPPVTQQK